MINSSFHSPPAAATPPVFSAANHGAFLENPYTADVFNLFDLRGTNETDFCGMFRMVSTPSRSFHYTSSLPPVALINQHFKCNV